MKIKNWKTTIYLIVVFGAIIAIIFGLSLWYYKYNVMLNSNNKTTKGVVLKRQARRGSDIYVEFSYIVKGRNYIEYEQVNYFEHINKCFFDVGDSLIIIYYPPDPEISRLNLDSSLKVWKSSR